MIRPTGASHAPERFSALRPPLASGRVKRSRKPRTQKCAAGTSRCGLFEIVRLDYGERFGDEPRARSVCAEPPHPEERAQPASRRMGRRVPSCFETPRSAAKRVEAHVTFCCAAPQHEGTERLCRSPVFLL